MLPQNYTTGVQTPHVVHLLQNQCGTYEVFTNKKMVTNLEYFARGPFEWQKRVSGSSMDSQKVP